MRLLPYLCGLWSYGTYVRADCGKFWKGKVLSCVAIFALFHVLGFWVWFFFFAVDVMQFFSLLDLLPSYLEVSWTWLKILGKKYEWKWKMIKNGLGVGNRNLKKGTLCKNNWYKKEKYVSFWFSMGRRICKCMNDTESYMHENSYIHWWQMRSYVNS